MTTPNTLPSTADVVVIGLGTIGSMSLWQTAEKLNGTDKTVVGIEQFTRVHTRGSYSGESRLFRVALKEGSKYIKLALAAREMWEELNERSGRDVFVPCKALSLASEEFEGIADTKAVLEEFDLSHTAFTADELKESYPQFAVDEGDVGILDHLGGGIRPELSVAIAQAEAEKAGAQIFDSLPVTSIDNSEYESTGYVTVSTASGDIQASRVIVTTGSWAGQLVPEVKDKIDIWKLPLTWSMPLEIENFLPEKFPIFLRDKVLSDGTPFHVYGAPSLDGYSVKVSAGIENDYIAESMDDFPWDVDDEFKYVTGKRVTEVFPDMLPSVARATMHHDGFTHSNAPIIGNDLPGITLAVGMSGRGMKFAPIYGKLAAQLAVDGSSDLYDDSFSLASHT